MSLKQAKISFRERLGWKLLSKAYRVRCAKGHHGPADWWGLVCPICDPMYYLRRLHDCRQLLAVLVRRSPGAEICVSKHELVSFDGAVSQTHLHETDGLLLRFEE